MRQRGQAFRHHLRSAHLVEVDLDEAECRQGWQYIPHQTPAIHTGVSSYSNGTFTCCCATSTQADRDLEDGASELELPQSHPVRRRAICPEVASQAEE
ncbi:hypothetical protein BBK14_30490 [Parafrankia soli]|uniref:Uncharacterized protein n=1 Tax=Parafrankia soli TaxID=2599596 RepID=A0A1S1RIR2_9ACTN|nr:hypothetical protein BBK14_32250 [Parafrankia soli]OHV45285.1 hypothetical protein BBK14_30490 [Parafrankia soli]